MSRWRDDAFTEITTFAGLNRSELMSRIRSKGNKSTEIRMVELLRAFKLTRWRRHVALPGNPDFSWRKERVVLFVDGCFWHGHDCRALTPRRNGSAWRAKLQENKRRDKRVNRILRKLGWSVVRVWECNLNSRKQWVGSRIQRALMRAPSSV